MENKYAMHWEEADKDDRIDALLKNLEQFIVAIHTCITLKLPTPVLALIYSLIDILGYLNMPIDKSDTTREDFISWVEKYFLPNFDAPDCEAIDVYAARCGILHSMSYESRLTRNKKAKNIVYAWGDKKKKEDLQLLLKHLGKKDIVLHIDEMVSALNYGMRDFLLDVSKNKNELSKIWERASKTFMNIDLQNMS